MNSEQQFKTLVSFIQYRTYILNALGSVKVEAEETESVKNKEYLFFLMQIPVSKISIFSDMLWDYNEDYPSVARNVQGAKLRIDFMKYPEIPPFVLAEVKVLLQLVYLNPRIFQPEKKGKRIRNKNKLKVNSIIDVFSSGLRFINTLFEVVNNTFGEEFIQSSVTSISKISTANYYEAAKVHDYVYCQSVKKFFDYLKHPYTANNILDGKVAWVDLDSLEWKKTSSKGKKKKNQIIQNSLFEELSVRSSFLITDFLHTMGKDVCDLNSLNYLKNKGESPSQLTGLNDDVFNAYRVLRLRAKGYSESFIKERYPIPSWAFSTDESGVREIAQYGRMDRLCRGVFERNTLRLHLNQVHYACVYIVGQYTGMRPSELSEIIVQDSQCLVKEGDQWLLQSTVKKHQEDLCKLFDDKWVAIPIIRDAIKAAAIIGTIKNNPYLVSNVDTVEASAEPKSMGSVGLTHQMDNFFEATLGKEIADKISFNPYMLRHTLAYQMFRADLGLPYISYQLKHFVGEVASYTSKSATSDVTLGYGEIGDLLSKGGRGKNSLRHEAEVESIKSVMDPDGTYIGPKAEEHKKRLRNLFQGYMAAGYTKEQVFEQMAEQGLAIVNVGQGYCYGGQVEDFDDSLPCIGGLRCNPIRCANAFVSKENAPKWREVYYQNKANLNKPEYNHNIAQMEEAINEAEMVLNYLGEVL